MDLTASKLNMTTPHMMIEPYAPLWIGYIAVLVAVLFFGSNLVPAAQYPIGDGMSFQFFSCCGTWLIGLVIHLVVKSPPVYPLALVGGILWTTGNLLGITAIPINGLGLSMLLWCTTSMLIGWASGYYGWFDITPQRVQSPILNYIGVIIATISGIVFLFVRPKSNDVTSEMNSDEQQPILASAGVTTDDESVSRREVSRPATKSIVMRLIGYLLAIVAGVFFGFVFIPTTYIQEHPNGPYHDATKNGIGYVFAMYSGILFSSMLYYIVYLSYRQNRPYVHVESILPGIVSGIMWGIAQAGFLIANNILNQTVAFPLITIGPSTIATFWSIFYFKDIVGRRNYMIIGSGTVLRILAAVFIILSKPIAN